jgi:hypothetical protein
MGSDREEFMQTRYIVMFTMLAGIGTGAAVVHGLHAQAKPPVYYISEIEVTNLDAYMNEYVPKTQAKQPVAGLLLPASQLQSKEIRLHPASLCRFGGAWKNFRRGGIRMPAKKLDPSAKNMRSSAASPLRGSRKSFNHDELQRVSAHSPNETFVAVTPHRTLAGSTSPE